MGTMASTATATETKLTLEAPEPVAAVAPEKAAGLVPIEEGVKSKLDGVVDKYVAELVAADANSPEFGKKVDELTNMGRKQIADAANHSNRFLDRPVRAMDKEAGIGTDLTKLRRTVEELDPGRQGGLTQPRKIFGIIPFGNRMRGYFQKYQSAQTHIAEILKSLASGKEELQ